MTEILFLFLQHFLTHCIGHIWVTLFYWWVICKSIVLPIMHTSILIIHLMSAYPWNIQLIREVLRTFSVLIHIWMLKNLSLILSSLGFSYPWNIWWLWVFCLELWYIISALLRFVIIITLIKGIIADFHLAFSCQVFISLKVN